MMDNDTGHTPGPWFISNMAPCPSSRTVIMAKRPGGACGVADVYLPPYPEGGHANARLITAAPDMHGLLADLFEYFDNYADVTDSDRGVAEVPNEAMEWAERIREVLAKGRVETQAHERREAG